MKDIADIHYITRDSQDISHAQQARLMFKNGIRWVQMRMKNSPLEEIRTQVLKALTFAKEYGGSVILNDHVELAKETGVQGIHLGLKDTSISEARTYLGSDFIIGGTANSIRDIKLQASRGANYIGLGPFRFTTTKKNLSPVIGLNGYYEIAKELSVLNIKTPVIAVGGITMKDIPEIKKAGIYGVAISAALLEHYKKQELTKE